MAISTPSSKPIFSGSSNPVQCAKCGACTAVCPVYRATGREAHTARGKLHLLAKLAPGEASARYAEILSKCLLCGACTAVCPRHLKIPAEIVKARGAVPRAADPQFFAKYLLNKTLASPAACRTAAGLARLATKLPLTSGLRWRLGLPPLPADPLPGTAGACPPSATRQESSSTTAYFSGCLARHLAPQIKQASSRAVHRLTGRPAEVPAAQTCCGQAAAAAGNLELARRLAKTNIAAFAGRKSPILTSCASCYTHLLSYPALLAEEPDWREKAALFAGRLVEFSSFFLPRLAESKAPQSMALSQHQPVLYHDPCHLRFGPAITREPREFLHRLGIEITELPDGPQCCGQGGLFQLAHPGISQAIGQRLLSSFRESGAGLVATTCTGCLLQWQRHLPGQRIALHLAELLESACAP